MDASFVAHLNKPPSSSKWSHVVLSISGESNITDMITSVTIAGVYCFCPLELSSGHSKNQVMNHFLTPASEQFRHFLTLRLSITRFKTGISIARNKTQSQSQGCFCECLIKTLERKERKKKESTSHVSWPVTWRIWIEMLNMVGKLGQARWSRVRRCKFKDVECPGSFWKVERLETEPTRK